MNERPWKKWLKPTPQAASAKQEHAPMQEAPTRAAIPAAGDAPEPRKETRESGYMAALSTELTEILEARVNGELSTDQAVIILKGIVYESYKSGKGTAFAASKRGRA